MQSIPSVETFTLYLQSNFMNKAVSSGYLGSAGKQSTSVTVRPISTIVHSTVVGRRSFGQLTREASPEVLHLVTRRKSSVA